VLENGVLCWQNAHLKTCLFWLKFWLQNLSKSKFSLPHINDIVRCHVPESVNENFYWGLRARLVQYFSAVCASAAAWCKASKLLVYLWHGMYMDCTLYKIFQEGVKYCVEIVREFVMIGHLFF